MLFLPKTPGRTGFAARFFLPIVLARTAGRVGVSGVDPQ